MIDGLSHPAGGSSPEVLGVGTDLVEVDVLRAALERRSGLRTRLFTDEEWSYAARHRDPLPHLAARFAAKEAVMKALGQGMTRIRFVDVEVRREGSSPGVALHATAAEEARRVGVGGWLVSLTHTRSLAHAMVIAVSAVQEVAAAVEPTS